ncbi:MAG: HAD hydrolase-like protein [Patescibacteria group bacterium]
MKLILDFDDTLSNNKLLKEHIYKCLEEVGVLSATSEKYYKEVRATNTPFSLKDFLSSVLTRENTKGDIEILYEKIMEICPTLLDTKLLEIVRKLGKDNCYLVTNGNYEYQMDKIEKSKIVQLFQKIIVVPGSKKEPIEKICTDNKDDKVVFVDNKEVFFKDLDMNVCNNLTTILYDEYGLESLKGVVVK